MSVIEHLREAAVKLKLTQDNDALSMYGQDESQLAATINQHYQDNKIEDRKSFEKRKCEQEYRGRKMPKLFCELSDLEKLPNEVYEKILDNLGAGDKCNLRTSCKGLYEKTTLMSGIFDEWWINALGETPPDFVLNSDKKLCVYVKGEEDVKKENSVGNFINRLAHRLSSLKVHESGESLMNHLTNMEAAWFPFLTSLYLYKVEFDNNYLLALAPQLEILYLLNIDDLDVSAVEDEDRCFTKLKTFQMFDCDELDVSVILKKCSRSLKSLSFDCGQIIKLEGFQHDLSSIQYLQMTLSEGPVVTNLLSKTSSSLKTLHLEIVDNYTNFSLVSLPTLGITTLTLEPFDADDSHKFLNKCPFVQNLEIYQCRYEVKEFPLKDLQNLTLNMCGADCLTSVLRQVSKSSLKTLNLKCKSEFVSEYQAQLTRNAVEELSKCEFCVLPDLDTVWITGCNQDSQILDRVHQLFPEYAQVNREEFSEDEMVFRRVYTIT